MLQIKLNMLINEAHAIEKHMLLIKTKLNEAYLLHDFKLWNNAIDTTSCCLWSIGQTYHAKEKLIMVPVKVYSIANVTMASSILYIITLYNDRNLWLCTLYTMLT